MALVVQARLQRDTNTTVIASQGRMLKFNFLGNFVEESPINDTMSYTKEVDMLSILVCGESVEVAYSKDRLFMKHNPTMTLAEIASIVTNMRGMTFTAKREGTLNGIAYSQYMYLFEQGNLNINIIK